jgi:NADH:ubiquinone oxidoreductase subunit C
MNTRDLIKDKLGSKITDWKENSARRIYFSVDRKDILETVKFLFKELGLRFSTASATELPEAFEILYHFSDDRSGEFYSVRVLISDKANPSIDALTTLFPGAEWMEREIWELFGIDFKGHPNLKRLLLADDWPQGKYPLRRSS